MRIKISDLKMFMDYATKEQSLSVDVETDGGTSFQPYVRLSFEDAEKRNCEIRLYEAKLSVTPDIIKSMKLYTRLPKPKE